MNILLIHNRYLFAGGEEEVLRSEAKMLEMKGHRVYIYERSNEELSQKNLLGKIVFVGRDLLFASKTYQDINHIVKEFKPDIAHLHNLFYMMSPSLLVALAKHRIPLVQTLHNYRYLCAAGTFFRNGKICEECLTSSRAKSLTYRCFKNSFMHTWFLKRLIDRLWSGDYLRKYVKRFIALSQFSRQKFISNGFDAAQVTVKSNFLSDDPGVGIVKEKYALYVGTMQPYKGVMTLLKAWQRFPDNYQLKLVGDGPLLEQLKAFNQHPGVSFLGRCGQTQVLDLMRHSSVVVLPSECYENFPRVIVEAYACATPVIASRIGAITELIDEGKTGFLFEPGNDISLHAAIKKLLTDKDLVTTIGQHARLMFEQRYSMQVNYEQLMTIYRDAMKGNDS